MSQQTTVGCVCGIQARSGLACQFDPEGGVRFALIDYGVVAGQQGRESDLALGGFEEAALVNICGEELGSVEHVEIVNFDGTKKSKRPDLVAFLSHRLNTQPSQEGIFIECKPVDDVHSLLTDYCDAGIARFIVGDYAWAMLEALMVGYNTVYAKPSTALPEPFGKRTKEIGVLGKPRDCRASPHQPPVAITRHKRSFPLRGRRAPAITLRHLWLATPKSL